MPATAFGEAGSPLVRSSTTPTGVVAVEIPTPIQDLVVSHARPEKSPTVLTLLVAVILPDEIVMTSPGPDPRLADPSTVHDVADRQSMSVLPPSPPRNKYPYVPFSG